MSTFRSLRGGLYQLCYGKERVKKNGGILHYAYRECSLGFEKKSFLADSDLMIESGLADSTSGSIDILKLIPPPPQRGGPF